MSLLVIGGHERMERDYLNMGKKKGYKTKVFTKMSSKVNNNIGNPDAIVILTSTVSHKLTRTIEGQAEKKNIPIIRHKSSSKSAFKECLGMVDECLGLCEVCEKKGKCCMN